MNTTNPEPTGCDASATGIDQDPAEISEIKPVAQQPGQVTVFVGRQRVATIPAEQAAGLGVCVGARWTAELAQRVEHVQSRSLARARAVRLLAAHPKSRWQLIDRLVQRGATRTTAQSVADELAELGLIDDHALARAIIESELRNRPAGRRALQAKLAQRRIDPAVCTAVLDAALADRDELADAIVVVRTKMRTTVTPDDPVVQTRRLIAHLARRGFSSYTARQAIERARAQDLDAGAD